MKIRVRWLLLAAFALAWIAAGKAQAAIPVSTPLARLVASAPVYHRIGDKHPFRVLSAIAPLTGVPATMPIVQSTLTDTGQLWLRVRLPGRPNSSTGWISINDVHLTSTPYFIIVNRAEHRVTLYRNGRAERRFLIVDGKPSTPTPTGHFYIEEKVYVGAGQAGPWILATSARSNVLQDFEGGPGQIGLHGRNLLGGTLGTSVSHGCIRFADNQITWLAHHVGAGVPVTII
jgi:lipoprotein-anchoring transpeptidase ErfK/SrfK